MKSFPILAALAAMGGGIDQFMPRLPSPRKRYVPQPVDHEAECRKFHGKTMRHRLTGETRYVTCWRCDRWNTLSLASEWNATLLALDWIRNADVVGGES